MFFKRQIRESQPRNESGKNYGKEEKFSLVRCSVDGIFCKNSILPVLNSLYAEAQIYRINKEYPFAINRLEMALEKTLELQESTCTVCAAFFRQNIRNSIENMKKEMAGVPARCFRFSEKKAFENLSPELRQLKSA